MSSTETLKNATITAVPALGQERSVEWPKRTARVLPNGLQVVIAESHNFPKMIAQLFFRSGNSVVAATQPGLADITASVVRTGTHSRSSESIEEDLRRIGSDLGTSAGADTSAISVAGLAEFSRDIFALIVDLARNAAFPVNEFERIRRHRLEELRIERTTPSFLAGERIRRVLFGAHPYAIVAPSEQQVQSYRIEDLKNYYAHYYSPSNALLIVVGDFDVDKILDQVDQLFGQWHSSAPPHAANPAPPHHQGRHVHLVHLPGTVQTDVLVGNIGITRLDLDWYRLALANSIYGGAFNSRLVMNIREQKGYTYSPRSSVLALREYGYFTIHAAVRNDVVAATLTEMFYEEDRMRSLPVGAQELLDAQSYMSGVFSLGVATQEGLVTQLSSVYLNKLPENYLDTYRESIRALSAEDVMLAARRHFDSANAQIVIVGDRAQIGEQAALFGEVTNYDATEPQPELPKGALI
jgi:predicted Zn-dependent peptidase